MIIRFPFFLLQSFNAKLTALSISLLVFFCCSVTQVANGADFTKVAVVNLNVLMGESPLAKQLSQQIKDDYFPKEEELNIALSELRKLEESLNDDTVKFTEEERLQRSREFRDRKRKYTRDYEDFRDSLSNARQKAIELVRQEVMVAVDQVRKKEGVSVVLDNYLFASEDIDLTPKVIKYLQTLYANTPKQSEMKEEAPSTQESSGVTGDQDNKNETE